MHFGPSRTTIVAVLCGLIGCEVITSGLGLGDDEGTETGEATVLDIGSRADADTNEAKPKQQRKRKRKRKRKRPEQKPPPPPETEFGPALARAIVAVPEDPGLYRLDPFVLTLVADSLGRGQDIPFARTTKKERRSGAPRSFKVGKLPNPSLWRRLGLLPGDLILAVEGATPPGPKRLIELRTKIPREGTLAIEIQRGGAPQTLRYRIEPGLAWTRYLEVEAERSFDPPPTPRASGPTRGKPQRPTKRSGASKPIASVPVTCSGSTCRAPKWYFDSLVGSSSKASQQMRGKSIGSGYKISFVGPASRKAGFAVGEVVTKINGSRTNNQLAMLGLYGRLKSTKKFRVESTRGGRKRVTTIIVE